MEPVLTFPATVLGAPLQLSRTPGEVFNQIFEVFLILGTVVGVVVTLYTLQYVYRYRAGREGAEEDDDDRPVLGELPAGGGKGRKLLLSFGLSTIIVVSLIFWTYGSLLFVESGPPQDSDPIEIEVEGYQFGWDFIYPNGHKTDTLRVPTDRVVYLQVTSRDVFHAFGVPKFGLKTDAIPGQYTDTWFIAEETGTYEAKCYELCGSGHSFMTAQVEVMEPSAFQEWYSGTGNGSDSGTDNGTGNDTNEENGTGPDPNNSTDNGTAA